MSNYQTPRLTPRQKLAAKAEPALERLFGIIDGHLDFRRVHWSCRADRSQYPSLFPAVVIGMDGLEQFRNDEGEEIYFSGPEAIAASWPLDFSGVVVHGQDATISRARSVTAKQVRGRITAPFPKMIEHTICPVNSIGRAVVAREYWGVRDDWSLFDISNIVTQHGDRNLRMSRNNSDKQFRIQIAAGAQLAHRYMWHVSIRAVGSETPLRIPTDGRGALSLLSLRDIEAGAARRRALRHWVRAHTRITANSVVDVREHLRGVTPFKWGDYEGFVEPPAFDLERLGEACA